MATVGLAFCRVDSVQGGVSAIVSQTDVESEAITSSATSTTSTNAADDGKRVARVAVTGGDVWVTFGSAPTAASGTTFLMTDGSVEYFAISKSDKLAVIDA